MKRERDSHTAPQVIGGVIAADAAARAAAKAEALRQQDAAFTDAMQSMSKLRDFLNTPENILGNQQTKHGEMRERDSHTAPQIIGGVIAADAAARAAAKAEAFRQQDAAFADAMQSMSKLRDFLNTPEHILGNQQTKHGEIAEQLEVWRRVSEDHLFRRAPSATFDGVGRTAPEDYLIHGTPVQSKFVNEPNQSLDHVLEHMHKYESFGRDGSYYHIPRDHHDAIMKLLRGEQIDGLSQRSADALLAKAREVERLSGGQDFGKVVQAGRANYADVQQGRIEQTIDKHEEELAAKNDELKEEITERHAPGLGDLAGAVGKGALVGAGVRISVSIYNKYKQGRSFKDYTADDWKDLGLDGLKGSLQGGVSAGLIFALTQYADLAAPFAAATVSSSMAVASLIRRYQKKEIKLEELLNLGTIVCAEGAFVALLSAAGQAVIPIPALGALVGAVAGRFLMSCAKDFLKNDTDELLAKLERDHKQRMSSLDREVQQYVTDMLAKYDRLGDLTKAAFDLQTNADLRLSASVRLAEAYGVDSSKIIHSAEDMDAFVFGLRAKYGSSLRVRQQAFL